jgi:hypothetical protein
MATGTLGTTGTTVLTSINGWTAQTAIADVAAIQEAIVRQGTFRTSIVPGGFSPSGRLFLPGGRGIIQMKPGDYIGVDSNGWPIVVTSESIAAGGTSWAHNP